MASPRVGSRGRTWPDSSSSISQPMNSARRPCCSRTSFSKEARCSLLYHLHHTAITGFRIAMALAPIPEIIAELKAGRMVVLVDEEDRENEGDVVIAADFVTPEAINFMARHARGLICLTSEGDRWPRTATSC